MYVVDANGKIRHHQFGEGEYERTEAVIQQLLREAGYSGRGNDAVQVDARGSEVAADWENLRSPENYLGRDQAKGFASPGGALVGKSRTYAVPRIAEAQPMGARRRLDGERRRRQRSTSPTDASSTGFTRATCISSWDRPRGSSVRFRVLLDGHPPANAHGADVDEQGYGTVTEHRLYQLIRQSGPIADRLFEIEFLDPGVEAYVFTFG